MMKKTIVAVSMAALLMGALVLSTPRKVLAGVVATLTRDQDNAGRHPYTAACSLLTSPTTSNSYECSILIPNGQQVVVENVTMNVNNGNGPSRFFMEATSGGNTSYAVQTQQPAANLFNGLASITQPTWVAADPNTVVFCQALVTPGANNSGGLCSISGYYVTLP